MNFKHKKSLGQHFLNSDYVPKQMCDAGAVALGDVVLEIGPGTGVLTHEILSRGARVVAIEADTRAIESLNKTFANQVASGQLTIFHHDARSLDMAKFGLVDQGFKVISNIPYYISGLLFRQCLESDIQPTDLVFLVQKEVAERIARDSKESILSQSVKVFGDPTYICTVKRGHFTPPPAVDSAVVVVNNICRDKLINSGISAETFFKLLHLAFGQKRKQLVSTLTSTKQYDRAKVLEILQTHSISNTVRAEDMPLQELLHVFAELSN